MCIQCIVDVVFDFCCWFGITIMLRLHGIMYGYQNRWLIKGYRRLETASQNQCLIRISLSQWKLAVSYICRTLNPDPKLASKNTPAQSHLHGAQDHEPRKPTHNDQRIIVKMVTRIRITMITTTTNITINSIITLSFRNSKPEPETLNP